MHPGHEIRDKHPEKVAAVRRHLEAAFGGALPESEEFTTDCLLFRTPSGGFVVVPDEMFEDYTRDELVAHLEGPWFTDAIKRLSQGDRLLVNLNPPDQRGYAPTSGQTH